MLWIDKYTKHRSCSQKIQSYIEQIQKLRVTQIWITSRLVTVELWNLQVQWWLDDGDDYIMMVDGDGSARGCHRELIGAGNVFWWGLSFVWLINWTLKTSPLDGALYKSEFTLNKYRNWKNNKYQNLFWQVWIFLNTNPEIPQHQQSSDLCPRIFGICSGRWDCDDDAWDDWDGGGGRAGG